MELFVHDSTACNPLTAFRKTGYVDIKAGCHPGTVLVTKGTALRQLQWRFLKNFYWMFQIFKLFLGTTALRPWNLWKCNGILRLGMQARPEPTMHMFRE